MHDIFIDIQNPDLGNKRIKDPRPTHLLSALRFLKKYPTKKDMSGIQDSTEKTALNRVWKYVAAIQALKEKKVNSIGMASLTIKFVSSLFLTLS